MALTVLCLVTALGSPVLVGLPVRWLLRRGRPLNERAWLEAPVVGLATIILALQNLVYLDVPLRRSVPWFWLAVGLLWAGLLWRRGLRGSWRHCPGGVLAVCVGVYLIQGLGVLLLGAPAYLGNRVCDQFNYITLAHFLADYPFSTTDAAIGPRPYVLYGLAFKNDRIGQSVLHGFLAVTAGQEPLALYEATSLLGPALLVVPFYCLGRGFGLRRWPAVLLGATAGLLPAVTRLHLDGYLSHTLVLPFAFLFLVTLPRALSALSVERALVAMLVAAGAASVYPEFAPILAGLLLALLVGARLAGCPWKNGAALGPAVLLAPLLLNPLSAPYLLPGLHRLSHRLWPEFFRTRVQALPELMWLGEEFRRVGWRHGLRTAGVVLTALGVLGLLALGLRQWRRGRRRPAFLLAVGVLALACVPMLAALRRPADPYPVYKLALSCAPLLALGLVVLVPRLRLPLLLAAATGTVLMEAESTWHRRTPYPHLRSIESDDFHWAERQVRQLAPGDVVLAVEPCSHAPWLSYQGRHHRIWLLESIPEYSNPVPPPGDAPVYLLVEDTYWGLRARPGQGTLLATQGRFSLWRWSGPVPPRDESALSP